MSRGDSARRSPIVSFSPGSLREVWNQLGTSAASMARSSGPLSGQRFARRDPGMLEAVGVRISDSIEGVDWIRPRRICSRTALTTVGPPGRYVDPSRALSTWRWLGTAIVSSGWPAYCPTVSATPTCWTCGRCPRTGVEGSPRRWCGCWPTGPGPAHRTPDRRCRRVLRLARVSTPTLVHVQSCRRVARQRRQPALAELTSQIAGAAPVA